MRIISTLPFRAAADYADSWKIKLLATVHSWLPVIQPTKDKDES